MYFVLAAIGEMRVNREDIVGQHSEEVKEKKSILSQLQQTSVYSDTGYNDNRLERQFLWSQKDLLIQALSVTVTVLGNRKSVTVEYKKVLLGTKKLSL